MSRFGKKKVYEATSGVELNIMPFIDIFSLLCTFLLFSAVFISIGIHVVQVPFLTNAAPSKEEGQRSLSVKVDASLQSVELSTYWSTPPEDKQTTQFLLTGDGLMQFHEALVKLRDGHPEADKVDLFVDNDLTYEQMIKLLDMIKLRAVGKGNDVGSSLDLFPKVVLGSVLL